MELLETHLKSLHSAFVEMFNVADDYEERFKDL